MKYTKTVMQHFEAQVAANPSALAITLGELSITYAELNNKANQLARTLRTLGVRPDNIVGIMVERSIEMIVGLFGILKAGGAYLPLLPDGPSERLQRLLKESRMTLLLTQTRFLRDYGVPTLDLHDEALYRGSRENLESLNQPEDLMYVIYTSGSTGKPKGVMIEHRSVINRLAWMQACYPIDQQDTLLQKTPFIFDVSVWELFWWCMVGSKLCLLKPGYEKFPLAIVECVMRQRITFMHFVPSMLGAFLNYVHAHDDAAQLTSLRHVFASGEALTPTHLKSFKQVLYDTNSTHLTNLYGPTEATVDVTYFDCPLESEIEHVPIGKPITNIEILILNEDNTSTAPPEIGELCIGGIGVARGYLYDPILTAEKFIAHPFRSGERIYRSGDLARWLPDGNIAFLGRADQQVKVRGIRIELGEIEVAISAFATVRQCVVITEQESETTALIVAFLVTEDGFSLSRLKEYIRNVLPDYMLPNIFLSCPDIPLTATGKADRKLLAEQRLKKVL